MENLQGSQPPHRRTSLLTSLVASLVPSLLTNGSISFAAMTV